MLEPKEIAKATKETLEKEVKKARITVAEILLKVRTGQSKANHEAKMWKKYIARMLTTLRSTAKERKADLKSSGKTA